MLTTKEKASRYDALQTAIKWTKSRYEDRAAMHEKQYMEAIEVGIVGAYSKGQADAFSLVAADLERWIE